MNSENSINNFLFVILCFFQQSVPSVRKLVHSFTKDKKTMLRKFVWRLDFLLRTGFRFKSCLNSISVHETLLTSFCSEVCVLKGNFLLNQ